MSIIAPSGPSFTSLEVAQEYLSVELSSRAKLTVLSGKLASAERFVQRYTRRYFPPEPALADPTTGYQRRSVAVSSSQQIPVDTGTWVLYWNGQNATIPVPVTALAMQALLQPVMGAGNVLCTGGPLPTYPIDVTFAGTLTGVQPAITADPTGMGLTATVIVDDCGFDSLPPVLKRFTTRGKTTIRMPDLRVVSPSNDPRDLQVNGVELYSRRLLPNQYYLGYGGYAAGGADEAIGSSNAEPATHIELGYGYGTGYSLAAQFSYVLPLGYMANDLQVVGRWGWNPVPPDIIDAIYSVAARLYMERNANFSDQMITAEGVVFQFFKQLPASIQGTLDTYRVPNIALI